MAVRSDGEILIANLHGGELEADAVEALAHFGEDVRAVVIGGVVELFQEVGDVECGEVLHVDVTDTAGAFGEHGGAQAVEGGQLLQGGPLEFCLVVLPRRVARRGLERVGAAEEPDAARGPGKTAARVNARGAQAARERLPA